MHTQTHTHTHTHTHTRERERERETETETETERELLFLEFAKLGEVRKEGGEGGSCYFITDPLSPVQRLG